MNKMQKLSAASAGAMLVLLVQLTGRDQLTDELSKAAAIAALALPSNVTLAMFDVKLFGATYRNGAAAIWLVYLLTGIFPIFALGFLAAHFGLIAFVSFVVGLFMSVLHAIIWFGSVGHDKAIE